MTHQATIPDLAAAAVLRRLTDGFRGTQALLVAAELGIADHLAAEPLPASELAKRTATDTEALRRLMRALCALGVFSEQASGYFAHNSVSHLLRIDVDGSFNAVIRFLAGPARWRCWESLSETIRTGESATTRILGAPLFEYYAANPSQSKIHDDAMKALSVVHGSALVEAIALRAGDVLVDVGGGTGQFLATTLLANPSATGILFDLPSVVLHAPSLLSTHNVSDRCAIDGGSFFECVPGAGDVYLLKQVIHDWDDERATKILQSCRRCMPQAAKLLIIERQMPELGTADLAVGPCLVDLEMLVMTPGGRERTTSEFRALLVDSGFTLNRITPTASSFCVFEACPN
jgi:hypothetical protein